MKLVVAGVAFFVALGAFLWMGIVEGSVPRKTLKELKAEAFTGECLVDDAKIQSIERGGQELVFSIATESDPSARLVIRSQRNPPDNFKVGNSVSVRGHFDPKAGVFFADDVRTSCPSKYEASKDKGAPALSSPAGLKPAPEKAP